MLTDPDLPSGSDRVLAALGALDPDGRCDVVVNLQGDMPFVSPAVITACLGVLAAEADCDIATAIAPEASPADRADPAVVKAVVSLRGGEPRGRALYFTRSVLYGDGPVWKHVGIYAYRRAALERFCAAPPSPLEQREKLEQLRALELGLSIWAAVVDETPISVDTPADLEAARAFARAEAMTSRPKIAFQGEPGANSDEACRDAFPRLRARALRGVRGRVRGGEVGRLRAGHDPGGELDHRPPGRRAPPAAELGPEDHRRAVQADPLPADGQPGRRSWTTCRP